MRGVIQRVFRDHYPAYRRNNSLSWRERWAAHNIRTCRTPAQGAHVVQCPAGDYTALRFNSCGHRSCPLCGAQETEAWAQTQQARALHCRYYQVIFTISAALHPLWAYHRRLFTNLLFRAAWGGLQAFFSDRQWLGAEPGALGAFQSWGETLNTHVHLHFLVTAGGLNQAGQWVAARHAFLFPARALSVKFRGKFRALLLQALAQGRLTPPPGTSVQSWVNLLNKLGRQKWNVRIEPPYDYPEGLIGYLAFYLRRGALAERRVERYDGQQLAIRYKRPAEHCAPRFELSAAELIARLLTHVPPKGLRMVRAYGLFHHHCRKKLNCAREQLAQTPLPQAATPPVALAAPRSAWPPLAAGRCPKCGAPLVVTFVYYPARDSPARMAV